MTEKDGAQGLRLARCTGDSTAPSRGRLMTAREIAEQIFGGHKSGEWIRRTIPNKVVLGHSTVMWYEADVWEFIESRREGGT